MDSHFTVNIGPGPQMFPFDYFTALEGSDLVVFINDLQNYVPHGIGAAEQAGAPGLQSFQSTPCAAALQHPLARVQVCCTRVVVIATCRIEDMQDVGASELASLLQTLKQSSVTLPRFAFDQRSAEVARIIEDFSAAGPIHDQDRDGTLGSLVLGLANKETQYLQHL